MNTRFGEILKEERNKRQMSQEQFAAFIGVTKQAVSYYERGERTPKLITAAMIANKLGIPIETFEEEIDVPMTTVQSFRLSESDAKQLEFLLLLQKHADAVELLEKIPKEKYPQVMDYLRFLSSSEGKK